MATRDIKFTLSAENRTRAVFGQIESGLKSLAGQTLKLSTGLAALSGVTIGGALATLAAGAVRTAGNLADLSDRTGLTVRDLSELKFAAEQSDTSLEALASGVGNLSRQLFAARSGNDAARQLFDALAIDPGQVQSSRELLLQLAERFEGIEDPMTRAGLAARLFGRGVGQELVTFLSQGREAIELFFDEAERSGAIIDEKFARAVDNANDNLAALRNTLTGSLTVALGNSASRVERISKAMRDAAADGASLARVLQIGLAGVLVETFSDRNLEGAERLRAELEQQKRTLEELQDIQEREPRRTTGLDALKDTAGVGLQSQIEATRGRIAELERQLEEQARVEEDAADREEESQRRRAEAQEAFAERLRQAKLEEAAALAAEKQLLQQSNRDIEKLAADREKVSQKFRALVADIRSGPAQAVDDLTDVSAINLQAREAIQRGDPETAIQLAEKAGDAIKQLQADGKEGTLVAAGMAREIQRIAEEAAKLKEQQGLELIAPKLDIEGTIKDVEILRSAILEKLADLEVRIKFKADTSALPAGVSGAADAAEGFAGGGRVRGPGTGTSDSVLAWLSNGEYVMPAAAVTHYGLAFFEKLRRMQFRLPDLPAFAAGGFVRNLAAPPPSGRPLVIQLANGDTISSADSDETIRRTITRAALKVGNRR